MEVSKNSHLETTLQQECTDALLPVRDALEVLNGQWKLPILITLAGGSKRFKQISRELTPITDKKLSQELKDLESNNLILRTVYETFPPRVEYTLTDYSQSLASVITSLKEWGLFHRKTIIG
ncbi:winged helix-turn-helix transcriptional regulator [Spirosoma pulveris]